MLIERRNSMMMMSTTQHRCTALFGTKEREIISLLQADDGRRLYMIWTSTSTTRTAAVYDMDEYEYNNTTTEDNILFDELTSTFTISAEIHDKIHAGVDFSGRFCLPSSATLKRAEGSTRRVGFSCPPRLWALLSTFWRAGRFCWVDFVSIGTP